MRANIIAYPCRGWCIGKVGEAVKYLLPESGTLVTFKGKCPHKGGGDPGETSCFFKSNLATIEILEGFT